MDELGATVWQAQVAKGAGGVTYGATTSPVSNTLVAAQALVTGASYRSASRRRRPIPRPVTSTLSTSEDLLGVFTAVP